MIKQKLQQLIFKSVCRLGFAQELEGSDFPFEQIELTHPTNLKYGDYASNIAFLLAKQFNKEAHILAKEVMVQIQPEVKKMEEIEKVEAVEGFINFYLTDQFFINQMSQVLIKKGKFGGSLAGRGRKVLIEFGQPNTHKLPHIGHFRSYVLGESLARLLEFAGHQVFRANYQGDVGLQVAKCLWALKKVKSEKLKVKSLRGRIQLLQEAYVKGNKAYEQDTFAKKEIDGLNLNIYQKNPGIFDLWQQTRQWSLNYYDELNKRLGVKYDRLYFESEAADFGKKIVLENLGKIFKESQGAIIFEGSKFDLHDRVFITAQGNPTYEAKDLGLIFLKAKDFKYDLSLISTASEQVEYFKVVYQAASLIDKNLAKKFVHIPFGLVSLSGGKLSSREGSIVSIDELLELVKFKLENVMKEKNYTVHQVRRVIKPLTIGAARYSLLKQAPAKNITFDVNKSVALEGNSGPYLHYSFARARSILRQGNKSFSAQVTQSLTFGKGWDLQKQEKDLLKVLYQFPEVVKETAQSYSPNLVCNYLFNLAQIFNSFYERERVIGDEREKFRLSLVAAVSQVLKNGLSLLGIEVLEKM